MSIDQTDLIILREIQKNAKITIKELSEKTGVSSTPIFERVKKLENADYIRKYQAILNPDKWGLHMLVMCYVSLRSHQSELIQQFQNDIIQINEVLECYHIAGVYDYLLKVIVSDIDAYQKFLSTKLATLGNIGQIQSNFVMNILKSEISIPL